MMRRIKEAVVIDPNPIFREGLVRVLSDDLGVKCVGFDSLESIAGEANPDWERSLFLVDFGRDLKTLADGIGQVLEQFPTAVVVVLSTRYSDRHMLCAFRAGASGYVLKETNGEAIVKSLQLICLGEYVFPVQVVESLNAAESQEDLDEEVSESHPPLKIGESDALCEEQDNKLEARGPTGTILKVCVSIR
jgi:two-component system, NarL family, nitrate/nitrite response regulator NarL